MPSSLAMLPPPALGSSPHPPVSVCGTGARRTIAAFPGTRPARFATSLRSASRPRPPGGTLAPPACCACAGPSGPGTRPAACVPAVLPPCSAGISTCCPSATPPGLALGPDSPRADQLHPGNLGYSAKGIPTPFSLLIPAFSLPGAPPGLPARLPRPGDAPLPARLSARPRASAPCFSPGHFRRGASRLVSYYALFERLAASGPTS